MLPNGDAESTEKQHVLKSLLLWIIPSRFTIIIAIKEDRISFKMSIREETSGINWKGKVSIDFCFQALTKMIEILSLNFAYTPKMTNLSTRISYLFQKGWFW